MSVLVFSEEDFRRILREELRILLSEKPVDQHRDVPAFLFVEDIAKKCGVEPPTVRSWIQSGSLSASKPGRHYLVTQAAFSDFLSKQQPGPSPSLDPGDQVDKLMARLGRSGGRNG